MRMVTKKIITFGLLALVLLCGVDAASSRYPTHSQTVFEKISDSLSDALSHPVQTVRDVKKFAVAPFSRFFGTYEEQAHPQARTEDSSSWMYPPHFDFLFSSKVDETDPRHPKYHMDIDIDVEEASYLEIMRQVTESLYEGGDKYVTQKVVVTEKIPAKGERQARGIEEVHPSRVEEVPEEEDAMRKFMRGEGKGQEKAPRREQRSYEREQPGYDRESRKTGYDRESYKPGYERERSGYDRDSQKSEYEREHPSYERDSRKAGYDREYHKAGHGDAAKPSYDLEDWTETLKHKGHEIKEDVKDAARKVAQKAEQPLRDMAESAKEGLKEGLETAEEKIEDIGDKLKNAGERVVEKEQEIRHGLRDTIKGVGKKIIGAEENLRHTVEDKLDHISEKIKDTADNVRSTIGAVGDKAQQLKEKTQDLTHKVTDKIHAVEDQAKSTIHNMEDMANQLQQNLEHGAKSLANMIYYPVHEFKKYVTSGVRSVGEFVDQEKAAIRKTTYDVKNAIAKQGEKIRIPPISEKLCDSAQYMLDTVCGGRQHHGHEPSMDKSSEWKPSADQYESMKSASKYHDAPQREHQQEYRKPNQQGYQGFVEHDEDASYGRRYRHSEHVEEEVCRPIYSRGAL